MGVCIYIYGRVRFSPLLIYKKSARPTPHLRNIVAATPRGKAATPPLRLHDEDDDDDEEDHDDDEDDDDDDAK
jgi:hypothetical protein